MKSEQNVTRMSLRRSFLLACTCVLATTCASAQSIIVSNPDGVPFPNRLVFNRIGETGIPPPNGVHDRATVRVRNKGDSELIVTLLALGGSHANSWVVDAAPPVPFTIEPGSFADVTLTFVAQSRQRIHSAKLSVSSNDPKKPTFVVQLRGYWQELSENGDEPSLQQLINIYGYKTALAYEGEDFYTNGKQVATGEEILSPFWQQAEGALPVTVQQLAAFHAYPEGHQISWHYTGSINTTAIFTHEAEDAQSVVPRRSGVATPAKGNFTPSAAIAGGAFGFRIEEDQWSNPRLNDTSNDDCISGPDTCGQHVRFWPARMRNGRPILNAYIMAMDFSVGTFDYQDNIYLVSNVKPYLLERPSVTGTAPEDRAADVPRDSFVAADVLLPNEGLGIDPATLTSNSVRLYPSNAPQDIIPSNLNTSGGGDAIVLQPTVLLAANTPYVFEITEDLKDLAGASFISTLISFTTGATPTGDAATTIEFEPVALAGTTGKFTSLTLGPDGKLYAAEQHGPIRRWTVRSDGTLSNGETLDALRIAEGGDRLLIGLAFDPAATATNLIAWISHSTFGFTGMPEWGSKITRLSGPDLEAVKDYVVDLPRSLRDHVTNGIAFGPDGAMYVSQGSNTAMGAPDKAWGNRPERLLTAAVLRIDISALNALISLPLNVRTDDGSYDPYAPGVPVKVFATGIRNAYDLVWHSNGSLYVPTNGSAANGKAPESVTGTMRPDGQPYGGPFVPAIDSVETQNDYLYVMPPPSGGSWAYSYYGHPNPTRGEYTLNGGNPTDQTDLAQVNRYPVGVAPDAAWKGIAFNFGRNISPNGVIEYQSAVLDGALQGKLLVARYSGGDDIIVLTPDASTGLIPSDGDLVGITGFTQLTDPIDLTENLANGHIYVSEFGGNGKITLLRPVSDQPAGEEPTETTVLAFAESDGQVTIEAEHFDTTIARNGHSWVSRDPGGAVNGSVRPEPVTLTNIDTDYATTSPELQYVVHFSTTGTYYVWVRAYAEGGDSDSWHVGLDSQPVSTADRMTMGPQFSRWRWINKTMDVEPATLQIDSAGLRVVNVWMREDGVYLDRLVLTTDAAYTPTGDGPSESPRASVQYAIVAPDTPILAFSRASDRPILGNQIIPDRFELAKNYPNPFNPITTIEYSLPQEAHVRLEVFDLFGRRVDLLVDRMQQAGVYGIAYDAGRLSSGVYVYRLRAGSFVRTSKMILSK